MEEPRWATTPGELARLRLLNLLGELEVLDCTDERARRASGHDLVMAWRYLDLRGVVVFDPVSSGGETSGAAAGMVMLSRRGALAYRARMRRVADRAATRWTVRGALLDWLTAASTAGFRCLAEFQRDPAGRDEVAAAAGFLANRSLVELIDTTGKQLAKVKATVDGHNLADQSRRTGHCLTAWTYQPDQPPPATRTRHRQRTTADKTTTWRDHRSAQTRPAGWISSSASCGA
ncbi:hypothetical protein [Kribbella sp. NBC_00359]|uniref:hypothetical protein n=1 Tax=Kribbella sp. NBC_00359 TaxID=2975966 RepID=UPI002E232BAB